MRVLLDPIDSSYQACNGRAMSLVTAIRHFATESSRFGTIISSLHLQPSTSGFENLALAGRPRYMHERYWAQGCHALHGLDIPCTITIQAGKHCAVHTRNG